MQRVLTIHGAAEALAVSPQTIRRLIARGELKAYRVGGSVRIRAEDVETAMRLIPTGWRVADHRAEWESAG